jgi:hypothetical protein
MEEEKMNINSGREKYTKHVPEKYPIVRLREGKILFKWGGGGFPDWGLLTQEGFSSTNTEGTYGIYCIYCIMQDSFRDKES